MKSWSLYRRTNCLMGWLMFVVSAIVYISTVEPTVSFWDCGEFILCGFKLQVGHPPGAPIFLMIDRIATLFAGGDLSKVALCANILSALCSALTIMFLFWSVTYLAKKILTSKNESIVNAEEKHLVAIMGAGMLGALTYTFTDTFWFSAVEGELYAMSSLLTALAFWAMLKWDEEFDDPHSGRWIILIFFMMGLGLGIHRLNLLVLPVMVFVYYFKKYEFSWKGLMKAIAVAVALLGAIVFIIIPYVPKVAGWFELLFVNGMGLPYNTGLIIFIVATIAALVWAIRFSLKKQKIILNYCITCFTVIMIGYSSYGMIVIRASANTPMNQNNPSDIFSLSYYINMQQYGSNPKVYGQYYSAPITKSKEVIAGYNKVDGKYEPYYTVEYEYEDRFKTIFPRMYSSQDAHIADYEFWGKVRGHKYSVKSSQGTESIICPTFSENLRFFFRYQCGFMYWRYFMWNFAGRQNDFQGNGNPMYGNWISGISFIDNARLGNQNDLPADLQTNPGRNRYYCIPLILGLLGLWWQYKKSASDFSLVLIFFLMTGLAIVCYLNQYPGQPRERDYAYAGSFYAFSIWIGLGLIAIYDVVCKYLKNRNIAAISVTVALLLVCPMIMASENWDDHNRSDRYTARDIGANYLNSTAENSIIFTYGDNDSFPVWYANEVENVRQDVRVVNLSYFQAGWYIDEMQKKAYSSDPLPMSLTSDKYRDGTRDQLIVYESNRIVPLKDAVEFAGQDDDKYKVRYGDNSLFNYLPATMFSIAIDSATVVNNGTVKPYFANNVLDTIIWKFPSNYAFKGNLAVMDILATNHWQRPIYYAVTVPSGQYNGLENFFVQEGLAYRIVPIKTSPQMSGMTGMMDTQTMYDNMVNKFTWGNAEKPDVYLDETIRRMFSNYRTQYGSLAKALLAEGDTLKAIATADRGLEIVPPTKMPYDYFTTTIAEVYLRAGENEKGEKLMQEIIDYAQEYLDYIVNVDANKSYGLDYVKGLNMQTIVDIYRIANNLGNKALATQAEAIIAQYYYALYPEG